MEYLKSFLIGGSVISGAKIAANVLGPELAPIVGGLPTGIIASFFLTSNASRQKFFEGYAYSSFILFLAILFIHLITSHYKKLSVNMVSGSAFIVWAILSYVIIGAHKKGKI